MNSDKIEFIFFIIKKMTENINTKTESFYDSIYNNTYQYRQARIDKVHEVKTKLYNTVLDKLREFSKMNGVFLMSINLYKEFTTINKNYQIYGILYTEVCSHTINELKIEGFEVSKAEGYLSKTDNIINISWEKSPKE